jgi:hypothetical protein
MPADTNIRRCPAAAEIAASLIADHYPALQEAKLLWLLTSQTAQCRPKVLGPLDRYLTAALEADAEIEPEVEDGYDLVCLLNETEWDAADTTGRRRAFIDHRLAHISRTISPRDDVVWHIDRHPVEEWPEVVARHGAWTPKLRELVAAAGQQLPLPEASPPAGEGKGLLYDDVRQELAAAPGLGG